MDDRCTGHCCESIHLKGPDGEDFAKAIRENPSHFIDGQKVVDMLIDTPTPGMYHCKWYDWIGKKCTNYQDRPSVCRDYPYGNACKFPGCTLKNRGVEYVPESA